MTKDDRVFALGHAFTPSAPVASRDHFAGRAQQVLDVVQALGQPGTHIVLFGERGVGKTSLANVLESFLSPLMANATVHRLNCTTSDTYVTLWRKAFRELGMTEPESWKYSSPDPDDIRVGLAGLPPGTVVILDEYDRIEDDDGLSLMADTLKALSDHAVGVKIIIVGVAESLDELVGEHESVQRALVEVPMPRMDASEIQEIVGTGLAKAEMTMDPDARAVVAKLAEGLPAFVHLLMLSAARVAAYDDRSMVTSDDVAVAITDVSSTHHLVRDYELAIQSSRRESLYAQVLTACALAEKNSLGYFAPLAVREPMSRIMEKEYAIPQFQNHLIAFTEDSRGRVLVRQGRPRNYTYRFRNPLLQPFLILAGLSRGVIPESYRADILGT